MALGAGVFVWCWLALLSEPGSGGSPSHTWHGTGDPLAGGPGILPDLVIELRGQALPVPWW